MSLRTLTNTQYFREPALNFQKYGYYCDAPSETHEFDEYWDIQDERCLKGYKVGDLWIPGRFYFYLNFFPMRRIPSKTEKEKNPHITEIYSFPNFWELDYDWWMSKHVAQFGATKKQLIDWKISALPIKDTPPGQHLACLKTRRGGFSYKEACDGVYNYNFIPMSKSYYFASSEEYLVKDGIFNKIGDSLEFLNAHTDWYKNRQKIDTKWHKKASYEVVEGGRRLERGYRSELISTILDKPDKARGKSGVKITFEEAGAFKNLTTAWEICMPQVKQGGITKGMMTAFGTGGTEKDEGLEGLSLLFNNPEAYECLPFDNIWDEDLEGTTCGFFAPATHIMENHIDKDGNVDTTAALVDIGKDRKRRAGSSDRLALIRYMAENPLRPSEALLRVTFNKFPVVALKRQLRKVQAENLQNAWVAGDIENIESKVGFRPNSNKHAINDWPIKPFDPKKQKITSLNGAVSILQQPLKNSEGNVYKDLYFISVDPYAQDTSEYSSSVGCAYVFKRENSVTPKDTLNNNIVASYIARPASLSIFWNNVFLLAEYYNCRIQSELIGGGAVGLEIAKNKKKMHLLEHQVDITSNRAKAGNKSFFMKVSTDMKNDGIEYLANWLEEEISVGVDVNDQVVLRKRLEFITDEGFLKELIKYNDEGNFDRISSAIVGMYMLKELENRKVKKNLKKRQEGTFFNMEKWFETDNRYV